MNSPLPERWEWGLGASGDGYCHYPFMTTQIMAPGKGLGYDGELYRDRGGPWWVVIRRITRVHRSGDLDFDYACYSAKFDTEVEAVEALKAKAADLW